jgi:hypothetical protein
MKCGLKILFHEPFSTLQVFGYMSNIVLYIISFEVVGGGSV